MSKAKNYAVVANRIVEMIRKLAKESDVSPDRITVAQLEKAGVSERSIRSVGGLTSIRARYLTDDEKDLAGARVGSEVKKKIKTLERKLGEQELNREHLELSVLAAVKSLKLPKAELPTVTKDKAKRSMTVELMLSDIHYGLKTPDFNLEVCRRRIRHLVEVTLKEIEDNQKLFNVERIIVALIGDIIQSATMHGLESAVGCEFGNSEQVQCAIESLWLDVIVPIARTGIKVDVPAVVGNHDRTEVKRTYNYPGKSNLTWIIYKTLEMLTKEAGFKNVTYYIPEGPYQVLSIYGSNCLYEHGDNSKANTKIAFESLMTARGKQVNKVLHFARFGHFHELKVYGRGRIIVNESVCGPESYGELLGYKSNAGQCINYYIETKSRSSPFYKNFPVDLDGIK